MIGNIPGIILLLTAFILLVLASCTAPVDKHLYFVKADFDNLVIGPVTLDGRMNIGMWGACMEFVTGVNSCTGKALGIELQKSATFFNWGIRNALPVAHSIHTDVAKGLILHPIAAVITFFALLFALSTHIIVDILASLTALLAALLTMIVFILDIVVFIHAKDRINDVSTGSPASLGNMFWAVMVAFICQVFAAFFVIFGGFKRRKDQDHSWYNRSQMGENRWWRRNRN